MSFQQLLDDICRLDEDRAAAGGPADFTFDPPPAYRTADGRPVDFRKSLAGITRRLERTRKRGRRLAKATGSVWDRLTPTGDDQPTKRQNLDKFLDRCEAAMANGEITGEQLIILEGVVNRMKAGMAS